MSYHTWLALHVFPNLTLVTCFISHMTCITSFPKLDTGYMSVPHVTSITCFPKLDTGYRGGSTGRVQGLCIPLKWSLLLFSKLLSKTVYLSHQWVTQFFSGATPPKKNPGSAPALLVLPHMTWQFHVFLCLPLVTCFQTHGSRLIHFFPCLALVTYFPLNDLFHSWKN